jgi:hypothetical protein
MAHEKSLLMKEQKEAARQLHIQNETLTLSFKVWQTLRPKKLCVYCHL